MSNSWCLVVTVCLVPVVGLLSSGCAIDNGNQPVGEAQSAIFDPGCGSDTNYITDTSNYDSCSLSSTPENSGTGYGDSSCTHAFIVAYTGTLFGSSYASAVPTTMPTTEATCNDTDVEYGTYDSSGDFVSSTQVWGFWAFGECSFPTSIPPIITSGGRIVAQSLTFPCPKGHVCTVPVTVSLFTSRC